MKYTTGQTGAAGEEYAVKFLEKNNYKILVRNFRTRYGEIDIIAENDDYIAFVEVKTRRTGSIQRPCEAVDSKKQKRLIKTAEIYLSLFETEKFCRFDVCEVYVSCKDLRQVSINYIEAAFERNDDFDF